MGVIQGRKQAEYCQEEEDLPMHQDPMSFSTLIQTSESTWTYTCIAGVGLRRLTGSQTAYSIGEKRFYLSFLSDLIVLHSILCTLQHWHSMQQKWDWTILHVILAMRLLLDITSLDKHMPSPASTWLHYAYFQII